MLQMDKPNVAVSLLCIHRVITRGLDVTVEKSQAYRDSGFPDDTTQEGFLNYARSLASVVHAHHLAEDELGFPYFMPMVPDAPYDSLSADHVVMSRGLAETNAAVNALDAGDDEEAALDDLYESVYDIREIWRPHIAKEEQYFSVAALEALIDPAEHDRLNKMFMQFDMEHSGPDYLVVPFMLFNLSEADRQVFIKEMPPEVTEQLIPVVWKEKWASMGQFLLR